MNRPEPPHWDVAAYALGVLDHRDLPQFEIHLAGCGDCAADLELLLPASRVLADVDPDDVRDAADHRLADRLVEAVRHDRRRARLRRRLVTVAGAALAAAALALAAGESLLGEVPPAGPGATAAPASTVLAPGIGGPELAGGERFSSTDPGTGVHADVFLEAAEWGTRVSFALSSLAGPMDCQLQVVKADGTSEVAASWRVPADGYGTAAQPAPLLLQATTAIARSDIDRLLVLAIEPDGATPMVTVPV